MNGYYQFLSGGIMVGSVIASALFFRFRARTGDPLFSGFGYAFLLFAAERVILLLEHAREPEQHPLTYLVRVAGFSLIIFAIVRKNRHNI